MYSYSRTKTASDIDGPYLFVNQQGVFTWCEVEAYGRVHHVTGSIEDATRVSAKTQTQLRAILSANYDALAAQGIYYDHHADIIVDGTPGGRNRMCFYTWYRAEGGQWDASQQRVVSELVATMRLPFKRFPGL